MLKKVVFTVIGILLVVTAFLSSKENKSPANEWQVESEKKIIVGAIVETVKNADIPIHINASGNLAAKEQIEIYSEVQGAFTYSRRPFKPGTYYNKGEVLLELDNTEQVITLMAEKSSFYNQLVQMMPVIKLDYPKSFKKWDQYISNYSVNRPLKFPPEPRTKKEKLFLSGNNVYVSFYKIKSSEEQIKKYKIRAPFSGTLIETMVNKGTLIRPNQRLGTFINQDIFELEVAIKTTYSDLLSVGKTVTLHNVENTKEWVGKVIRVNKLVDATSQTTPIFIQVKGDDLSPGMYLEADIMVEEAEQTYEINRQLLVGDDQLFIVRDSELDLVHIKPVFFKKNTLIVKGLEDGMQLLSKVIPSAHKGMKVKVLEENMTAF